MSSDDTLKIVLSAAEVQRWRKDAAEIDAQVERLLSKKAKIMERVSAAEILAPSLFIESSAEAGDGPKVIKARKGLVTWTALIEEIVRNSVNGISQKELLAEMRKGPYSDRLIASESGYYGAMAKLLKRDILKKRGDYLFTAAQYDAYLELLAAGTVVDVADNVNYGSQLAATVMEVVKINHPAGISPTDTVKALQADYETNNIALPSRNTAYNCIARLVEQKHLSKKKGMLYLREAKAAKPKNEAQEGEMPLLRVVK